MADDAGGVQPQEHPDISVAGRWFLGVSIALFLVAGISVGFRFKTVWILLGGIREEEWCVALALLAAACAPSARFEVLLVGSPVRRTAAASGVISSAAFLETSVVGLKSIAPAGKTYRNNTHSTFSQPDLIFSPGLGTEASSSKNTPAQFIFIERGTIDDNTRDGPFVVTTPTAPQSFRGDVREANRSHVTRMDLPPGDSDPSGSLPLADPLMGAEVPTTLGQQVEISRIWAEEGASKSEVESWANHTHPQCLPPSPPQPGPARPEDNTASQSQLMLEEHRPDSPSCPKVDLPAIATPQSNFAGIIAGHYVLQKVDTSPGSAQSRIHT
ncbi:hypothetical protein V8F33_013531 [Rhypophila sp. PSN 637]